MKKVKKVCDIIIFKIQILLIYCLIYEYQFAFLLPYFLYLLAIHLLAAFNLFNYDLSPNCTYGLFKCE